MKTRFVQGLVIVALVVPFSSCPLAPRVSLGVWIFDITSGTTTTSYSAELLRNGSTQPPSNMNGFPGTSFWEQNGATFTLEQVAGPTTIYTGTVDSPTSIIDGTWMVTSNASPSGTWTAMKL